MKLMKMLRKAQGATEYLIILAVVIIIALIVIGALGGIPGIGKGAAGRSSASYWNTADVAITSYSITTADAVTLKVRNNLKTDIIVNNVTLATDVMTTVDQTLAPGETKTFSGTMTGSNVCANTGDHYSHDETAQYKDKTTSAFYRFTGDGVALGGVCSV